MPRSLVTKIFVVENRIAMNSIHSIVLSTLRSGLISNLEVNNDIIGTLKSEYNPKDEDVQAIQNAGTKEEQVNALLDILPELEIFLNIINRL